MKANANKKRILIVSRSFYPAISPRSFRTTELVKEFARQGHEVKLLTLKDDEVHIPFEKEHAVSIKDLGPLRFPAVQLNGHKGRRSLFKRALRRGLLQLFEYPDIELLFKVKKALREESGFDLLISIAVPHPIHWGTAWAWRKENPIAKTWVADCGDPYMGQTLDSFDKIFYFKYFEKYFCKKTDYISVPLEDAKDGYYPEFRNKMEVIPQGFKFEDTKIGHFSYTKHDIPTFGYAGSFIPGGRDPRPFLNYLASIELDFKFIIYTKNVHLITPWLNKAKGKIEARKYIPRKKLLQVLSKMDFLVNFENQTSLQMPSKLIDYYLAGRPVLNVPANKFDTNVINRFIKGDYRDKLAYNDIDQYRIKNVSHQFLDLCNKTRG